MEINRNNYQIWITDYYDGSLSENQAAALHRFLDLNPDIKEEFDSFQNIVLHPDISIRIDKEELRKEIGKDDPELIEHCAIALSENDLDKEIREELLASLDQSDLARSETELYKKLKLVPDNTVYPYKSRLKRIPLRLVAPRLALRVLAVAAAVTILITLSIILPGQADSSINYNSSLLLPFNNSGDLSQNVILKEYKPVLASRSVTSQRVVDQELPVETENRGNEPERVLIAVNESPILDDVSVTTSGLSPGLLAMTESDIVIDEFYDEKLSPRQFVALNFRKILLKEDVNNTGKLKAYEVADVGIEGLNKLLGWEMQFEKEKTEDGRLASFRFTSQLLNLDHKMKNVTDEL